jgi:hypothetical protein
MININEFKNSVAAIAAPKSAWDRTPELSTTPSASRTGRHWKPPSTKRWRTRLNLSGGGKRPCVVPDKEITQSVVIWWVMPKLKPASRNNKFLSGAPSPKAAPAAAPCQGRSGLAGARSRSQRWLGESPGRRSRHSGLVRRLAVPR